MSRLLLEFEQGFAVACKSIERPHKGRLTLVGKQSSAAAVTHRTLPMAHSIERRAPYADQDGYTRHRGYSPQAGLPDVGMGHDGQGVRGPDCPMMQEVLGGQPLDTPIYRVAFAAMQHKCPDDAPHVRWRSAIADAFRFLERWGHTAATLRWPEHDLFAWCGDRVSGLCWELDGRAVLDLSDRMAIIEEDQSRGRTWLCCPPGIEGLDGSPDKSNAADWSMQGSD